MTSTIDTVQDRLLDRLVAQPAHPVRLTAAATPKLGRRALVRAQRETLDAARREYSLAARFLFFTMDLVYGRRRTLAKFEVAVRPTSAGWTGVLAVLRP